MATRTSGYNHHYHDNDKPAKMGEVGEMGAVGITRKQLTEVENYSKTVKVIKGRLEYFENQLNKYLDNGYYIPSGEAMKIHNDYYSILVLKKSKTELKVINAT